MFPAVAGPFDKIIEKRLTVSAGANGIAGAVATFNGGAAIDLSQLRKSTSYNVSQ